MTLRFDNEDEYKKFLASRAASGAGEVRKPKPSAGRGAARKVKAKGSGQTESKDRYRIVVIAKRRRSIDPDNVFPKWFIDRLVEAGYLPDDSSKYVAGIEKRVEKVGSDEREETIIEIWKEERP